MEALEEQIRASNRLVKQRAAGDPVCARLMNVPGVAPITALTPDRSKPRRAAAFAAMMPARRSRAASATSSPTPAASCCSSSSTPPTFRTATARLMSSRPSATASRGCAMSSPMAATPATNSGRRCKRHGKLDARDHQAFRYRQGLRGATAALGGRAHLRLARPLPPPCQRLGALHRKLHRLGATSPRSVSSPDASQDLSTH